MNNPRETVAYPPRPQSSTGSTPKPPALDTGGDTLFAGGPAPTPAAPTNTNAATLISAPESTLQTMIANEGATLGDPSVAGARPGRSPGTLAPTRGHATVLPDVRSEGDNLIIVPRDRTRYQNDKLLGRGGMGEVKLAHDHDIGRKVAVKRLLDEGNPHAVARFIDEVRTVGSLEHPNIVPIHDVGVDEDGSLFFVMKYVEGETLSKIIEELAKGNLDYHKRYSFEARLDLFVGLLRALQYAHSQGLVHRDVKPENVMVGRYGEVVLMDWGIAHQMRTEEHRTSGLAIERASTETVDGAVVGTPQYMSPEQSRGEVAKLDGRSDLYSAFVLFYELLTLAPHVEAGSTAMATVVAVQDSKPPSVTSANYDHPHQAAVPIEYRHFLRRGLQQDPDERYSSAIEVIYSLDQVRSGDFAVACPITLMKVGNTMMERFMDRNPLGSLVFAGTTALMFLGGVAGWAMWAMS